MAIGSIVLAVLALACAAIGFVTTPIPVVGAAFSFTAPTLALLGIVLGGVAQSRAKREGSDTGVARAGVITSVIAFLPGLVVALFCGTCNALFSAGHVQVHRDFRMGTLPGVVAGAGAGSAGAGGSSAPDTAPQAPEPQEVGGAPAPPPPGQPALPPPPLPAGPRRDRAPTP